MGQRGYFSAKVISKPDQLLPLNIVDHLYIIYILYIYFLAKVISKPDQLLPLYIIYILYIYFSAKVISKPDQLLPLYIVDHLSQVERLTVYWLYSWC